MGVKLQLLGADAQPRPLTSPPSAPLSAHTSLIVATCLYKRLPLPGTAECSQWSLSLNLLGWTGLVLALGPLEAVGHPRFPT